MIHPMPNSTRTRASIDPFRPTQLARLRQAALLVLAVGALACGNANSSSAQLAAAGELPRVEVFVTDWCPYCQRLEAFLKQNRVPYERKNIEKNADARAEHEELGGGGIPVTRIGGKKVIRGFRPDVIGRALGLGPDET